MPPKTENQPEPTPEPKKETTTQPDYDFSKFDTLLSKMETDFEGITTRFEKLLSSNPKISKDDLKVEFKTVLDEYIAKKPKETPKATGFIDSLNEMLGV